MGRRAAAKELDRPTYSNTVRAVAALIGENPDTAESRVLAKIFRAVVSGSGEFREAEVYLLSARGLVIGDMLIEAAMNGRIPLVDLLRGQSTARLSQPSKPLSERSRRVLELVRATGHDPSAMSYDDFLTWIAQWEGKVIAGRWVHGEGAVVEIR